MNPEPMSEETALATKADVQAVKTELKAEVQSLRSEIKADVQAVRAEVQSLRSEIKTDIQSLRSEFKADIEAVVERLLEAVHDAETRVLNAFYGFAQTNQKRMTLLEATDTNMISRLGTVESRVLEIEKRLNIPPAA